mmetsp:Transcript_33954/g.50900  ORF Transcript_33954/g.50900 Transcript_33954/m.50900 type:complete len:90 (+) Transcript_33954:659-928(+)
MREEAEVALGPDMTLRVGDLVIELSPHWEELAIFLYGFGRQIMGWSALFPRAPGQIRHITNITLLILEYSSLPCSIVFCRYFELECHFN